MVNWSLSIWQNKEGGLAHRLSPSFSVTDLPAPLSPEGSQPHAKFLSWGSFL